MPASVISLCNRSLLSVGARASITSLTEGSVEANACSILFAPTFEQLARTARWNCLKKTATLSLLKAASGTPENPSGTLLPLPPQPWLYSYALPSDCLDVRFLQQVFQLQSTGVPLSGAYVSSGSPYLNPGNIPFSVSYDVDSSNNPITVILTDLSQAQIVYTVNQPNPDIWDSLFQSAYVASLAAYLVPALTLNLALLGSCIKQAENAIIQARVADGNEAITSVDRIPDWMRARASGGNISGLGPGSYIFGNCLNMSWPTV